MKLLRLLRQASRHEFKVGDVVKETRTITQRDLDLFSDISGDHNTIHKSRLDNLKPLVHGAYLNSIVAGIIGTKLPGPGTIVVSQSFSLPSKCHVNDPIEILVELLENRKLMKVKYEVRQQGNVCFVGDAKLVMMSK